MILSLLKAKWTFKAKWCLHSTVGPRFQILGFNQPWIENIQKKFHEVLKNRTWTCLAGNCFGSIYMVLGMVSNLAMTSCVREDARSLWANTTRWASSSFGFCGVLEPVPYRHRGMVILVIRSVFTGEQFHHREIRKICKNWLSTLMLSLWG